MCSALAVSAQSDEKAIRKGNRSYKSGNYEQAIENGNDLARSNLADILRKGTQGYPKDLRRAFDLYKACGLPYAHYRVGEFYEHGWGVRQDLEAAKAYYRQAYKEGHGLATKKLKEFNFLE